MIVKSENNKRREYKGTSFDVLTLSDKSMFTIIHYGGITERIKSGDCYCNSENVVNSWEVLEAGEVIGVFTHPRIENL